MNLSSCSRPPRLRKRLARGVLWTMGLLAVLTPLGVWRYCRHNFKRFQEVRPGVMYRMGQPSEYGLRCIVQTYGVRTVACLRDDDPQLNTGLLFGFDQAPGREEQLVSELGARYLHWNFGGRTHWPWPDPWYLERFFELLDDPTNWPVLFHCAAGKHRVGTASAIFRLEYDRWDVDRTLDELYWFGFGTPRTIQEHNLRTYLPRPRPEGDSWNELQSAFREPIGGPPPADFEAFLRQLRAERSQPQVKAAIEKYLADRRPFALGLAQRLIDTPEDPLVFSATKLAGHYLAQGNESVSNWTVSAGLVADFGDREQQEQLLTILKEGAKTPELTPHYQAIVVGVTGRYTRNRIAYLRPLLDDLRQRPEPVARQYRYADTAVARLTSIIDVDYLGTLKNVDRAKWDRGIEAAKAWFANNPKQAEPQSFTPPKRPNWVTEP